VGSSICQRRHGGLQRRHVDRARDPHPSPGSNSISIDPPLLAGATGQGFGPDSATTIAGTKPG